ncbi:coiled-coil domain-containing protein 9 isoform X3 [Tyto alba]|uniref:coiled-coil domain-containing protein 9 isoform X3 n=1 Tax=Tyto alba TaxID=56313 RepID=UPI001C678924|nr:coiled-coil domain-containing protein 9 isoform X3 [Tyto alba]
MSAALDLRSKEEKDAELDKRIEALRKKNEALIKRYQEIEEDRKKAEQEGIAVTALRRARPPDAEPERRWVDKDLSVTVQVMLSPGEKRTAKDKKPTGTPKPGRGAAPRGSGRAGSRLSSRSLGGGHPQTPFWEGTGGDGVAPGGRGRRPRGRGAAGSVMGGDAAPDRKSKEWEERRRQNIEKMNEEMEKIAEYERNQRDGLHEKNPVRNFLDDPRRSGPFQDADRKEGSRRHVRNWGGADFDKVKAGMEREKTWQGPLRTPGRRSSPKSGGLLDMTLSMTGRERAEYVRWKKEREQIDQERLARHRKPTGQWRREWDAEKSDSMFKDGSAAAPGSEEENKHLPPKPPTFGEFLAPHRAQRRRKSRGRGQGAGAKPYSMHDNRWEEKELPASTEEAARREAEEAPSGALPEPPRSLSPEEDEDQWEDVSEEEEEEEEEEEGSGSPGSLNEAEGPRSLNPGELTGPPRGVQSPAAPPQGEEPRPNTEQELLEKREEAARSRAEDGTEASRRQPDAEAAPGTVEITDFERTDSTCKTSRSCRGFFPAPPGSGSDFFQSPGSASGGGGWRALRLPGRLPRLTAKRPDVRGRCPRHPGRSRRDPSSFLETLARTQVGSWWRMDFSMPNYTFNYSNLDDYSIYDLDGYEVPHSYRAVLALYALIFLLGVLGNGAVIWVTGFELRRTVNGVWFLNLSVADLLCCLALPFLALPLARDHHWPLGRFACKLLPSLTILNMFASVLLLMAISADRCALVTRPVWCQNHRTLGLARGACAAAWFLAGLLTLPSFIFRTTRLDYFSEKTTCVLDYAAVGHHQHLTELVTAVTRFVCGFLVPFVVITACYSLLLARVHSKGFARSQKAIKLILVVILSFFVCWLPYHVVGLILASTRPHSSLFKGALEADPIVAGVAYINSCINPIIYVVMGQDFKDKVQRSWRAVLRGVLSDDPTSTMGDSRMKTKSTVDDQSVSTTV